MPKFYEPEPDRQDFCYLGLMHFNVSSKNYPRIFKNWPEKVIKTRVKFVLIRRQIDELRKLGLFHHVNPVDPGNFRVEVINQSTSSLSEKSGFSKQGFVVKFGHDQKIQNALVS